jgi:hypothetical protein
MASKWHLYLCHCVPSHLPGWLAGWLAGCRLLTADGLVLLQVTGGEVNGGVGVHDAKVGGMLNVHMAMIGASFKSRHSHEEQDANSSDVGPADAA